MASEATKIIFTGNMHMKTRVIVVGAFKSEFKLALRDLLGCVEASKSSEAT